MNPLMADFAEQNKIFRLRAFFDDFKRYDMMQAHWHIQGILSVQSASAASSVVPLPNSAASFLPFAARIKCLPLRTHPALPVWIKLAFAVPHWVIGTCYAPMLHRPSF